MGAALDIAASDLENFLGNDESSWDDEDEKFAVVTTTLFLYIVMSIDDTSTEGDNLLGLLYDKYDRCNHHGRSFDDGAGAYKELVQTYGGVTKVSTIGLINCLKDIRLKGSSPNEVAAYEAELSNSFVKLEQAGEIVSDNSKKAYLINGLSSLPEWQTFAIEVTKQDLNSKLSYADALMQLKQLAPTILQQSRQSVAGDEGVYVAVAPKRGKTSGSQGGCWRCGGKWRPKGHTPDECGAKRRGCNHCGGGGHIANACPNKGKTKA